MSTDYGPDQDHWEDENFAPFVAEDLDDAQWMLLSAYADGETTPEEAAQAQELIRSNVRIAHAFALITTASRVAKAQAPVEPPSTLRAAIRAATTQKPTLARRLAFALDRIQAAFRPAPARLALAGSALAGIALLTVWARNEHPGVHSPSPGRLIARVSPQHPSFSVQPSIPEPYQKSQQGIASAPNPSQGHPHKRMSNPSRVIESHPDFWDGTELALNSVLPQQETIRSTVHNRTVSFPHAEKGQSVKKQRPQHPERHDADPNDGFGILPNMDRDNQTDLARTDMKIVDGPDPTIGSSTREHSPTTDTAIHVEPAVATSAVPAPRLVRVARMAQLPTDTRHFLPASDIRRAMEARNLNLNTVALESIHRGQASVSLFSSRF